MLVLALLLLSSSWNVQANGKKARAGNRSDAIIIPSPVINYARPNLHVGTGLSAGPADIWNPDKGFLVQSINPESYSLNFPTTGAHNLYFDLLISGVDINELTWEPVTLGGITATVTNVVANDRWIPQEDKGEVVVRVKLTGPDARNQWPNPNPNPIVMPQLPQTFELVGRDINTGDEVVKYGFELRQWFFPRWGDWLRYDRYSEASAWCNGLGYRMPRVNDLTNTICSELTGFPCIHGVRGAKPWSRTSFYMRYIGAGFFTEWGHVGYYADANFIDAKPYSVKSYWTSDEAGGIEGIYRFTVASGDNDEWDNYGNVFPVQADVGVYTMCTAP